MEWYNDGSNDSRSHAIKILLRTDQPRWHFCFSPKMFSYLPVLLSWSEWSKHVFNKISEFKHSCLRSSYLISFKCCPRQDLFSKLAQDDNHRDTIWKIEHLIFIAQYRSNASNFFVRGGTSNILRNLAFCTLLILGWFRINQTFSLKQCRPIFSNIFLPYTHFTKICMAWENYKNGIRFNINLLHIFLFIWHL